MTLEKHMPLVLMIFALMSILPAAMVPPSAIAQEEDDDDENIASSIVSDVLEDGSSDAEDESNQDATNIAAGDSNQEQDVGEDNISDFGDDTADLDDANVAVPLGIPVNVQVEQQEEPDEVLPPEEQPEFVAFCFERENIDPSIHCLDTPEDCAIAAAVAEDVFGDVINPNSPCEGVETLPTEFWNCEVIQNGEPSFECNPGGQD
jgi:hypothetical protein